MAKPLGAEAADPFVFSRAVVCGISPSLPAAAVRLEEPGEAVNLEKAHQQHQKYVEVCMAIDFPNDVLTPMGL